MVKRTIVATVAVLVARITFAATPMVTDVVAKQRFPWNGMVDITCTVSGIEGTTNGLYFSVAAVPEIGDAMKVSRLWMTQNGAKLANLYVCTNGNYRLLWDAQADLGQVIHSNMVVRVTLKSHGKVQLWEGGPYWADTNIGAYAPEDYGYYFWWGDTIGYKRENDKWVASDGSSSNYSFGIDNTPTYNKDIATLQSEGWITTDGVLAPAHDAAHVHWGGDWRMPTEQELEDLSSKCDFTWTTMNGVEGCRVRGKGDYSSASIFLPVAGGGYGTSLATGPRGRYWGSVPYSDVVNAHGFYIYTAVGRYTNIGYHRIYGQSVRPVQGVAK